MEKNPDVPETKPDPAEKEPPAPTEAVKAIAPPVKGESPVSFPAKDESAKDASTQPSSLERVLDVEAPKEVDDDKPPHLQAPKYVHHFDTWTLVKDLEKGGFTQDQSISLMKAVRGILADNIDLARKALVSKSNVENVGYTSRDCAYF